MTALNRVDPRQFRLVVLVLTTALVVAAALAVYFATTRTSTVTSDSPGAFSPSIGQQDAACLRPNGMRPNIPC